jgi:c-di-AMP phosphodiesterase-like protein
MVNVTKPEIAVKEIIEKEKSWEVILALQSTTNNSMKKRGLIVVVDKKSGSVLGNPTSFPI